MANLAAAANSAESLMFLVIQIFPNISAGRHTSQLTRVCDVYFCLFDVKRVFVPRSPTLVCLDMTCSCCKVLAFNFIQSIHDDLGTTQLCFYPCIVYELELPANLREVTGCQEKVSTLTLSLSKAPTSAFTFHTFESVETLCYTGF